MAPIRTKANPSKAASKKETVKDEEYEAAIDKLKSVLNVTPKTAKHFCSGAPESH